MRNRSNWLRDMMSNVAAILAVPAVIVAAVVLRPSPRPEQTTCLEDRGHCQNCSVCNAPTRLSFQDRIEAVAPLPLEPEGIEDDTPEAQTETVETVACPAGEPATGTGPDPI